MRFTILIIVCFFSFFCLGDGVPSKLRVDIGRGRLSLQLEGLDIPEEDIQKMEAELLVDESLASLVMGSHLITIDINKKDLGKDYKKNLKAFIKRLVQKPLTSSTSLSKALKPQISTYSDKSRKERSRVVIGSNFVVKDKDFYDQVVIMGGQVDVYGTVGELIVLGGKAHIYDSGVIKDEVVVMGGPLQIDPGAQVMGDSVNMNIPPFSMIPWGLIFNLNKFMDINNNVDSLVGVGVTIFEILIVILILWLCLFFFPSFHRGTQELILKSPGRGFLFSLVYGVLFGPVILCLCISIIGMVLLPLIFSLSIIFIPLGLGQSALWLGSRLNTKLSLVSPKREILLAIAGLVLLELVTFIPYIGIVVKLCFYMVGFGAVIETFYRMMFKGSGATGEQKTTSQAHVIV